MQVWDGISDSRIEFSAASIRGAEMARLMENLNLQRALLRRIEESTLDEQGRLSLLDKIKVLSIEPDPRNGWPLLHLSNSETIRARLLVGADGPSSPVRTYSNIDTYGRAYNARGVVATLRHPATITSFGTDRNHTTAYQRFLPTGPIAFLPIGSTTASLVWSTTPELAQALVDAGEDVLTLMINAAFRLPDVSMIYLHRLLLERWSKSVEKKGFMTAEEIEGEIRWRERSHDISSESALASTSMEVARGIPAPDTDMYPPLVHSVQPKSAAYFPLRMAHADSYMGKRTVLVGDAAHTVHPLAGQGLNLGLADVQCLSNVIQRSAAAGTDIGSHIALEAYPRERYFANHILLSAFDKLAGLYGTRLGPIVWLRSAGIETINEIGSIKDLFMGIAGAGVRPYGETAEKGMNRDKNDWTTIATAAAQHVGTVLDGARAIFGSVAGGRRH
jgi:ubiquinone biosynthesis monooxygenase Coq6